MKITVPPQVQSMIDAGASFVANHSGGKDSQAMLIRLLEIVPASQIVVVHAALGEVEWEGAMELAEKQALDAGLPFIVATAVKDYFEMVEHRYTTKPGPASSCFPSAQTRQCTSDLKRGPIEREVRRYARERGITRIVTCLGIRGQESPGRSKRAVVSVNKRGSVAKREWLEWNPIHDYSVEQVFTTIAEAGQKPHWAYAAGNQRLSCCFCIMGSPRDIANAAAHRPELYQKFVALEQRTGFTMHQSRLSLPELVAKGQVQLDAARRARSIHIELQHAP